MSFLNPLYLFGLAAAAIPVVIHLFTRKRPREVPFSSLEFLTEVNKSEIRRIQQARKLTSSLRLHHRFSSRYSGNTVSSVTGLGSISARSVRQAMATCPV